MSLSPKQANNERLRALCKDSTRQAAIAKRNPRRTAWNGIGAKAVRPAHWPEKAR